jgi:anti-sigma factor RsiW
VDGELGHETRERVLAHVATCPKCKAEVDEQRRLKNVFARTAPPPPSESLLARLQGLPQGGDPDGGGTPPDGGGLTAGLSGRAFGLAGVFGVRRGDPFAFDYAHSRAHPAAALTPAEPEPPARGFRVHPVGRAEGERPASRGLRFAFVAAGAVSLAALALGGVTAGIPGDAPTDARGTGSNVTPAPRQAANGVVAPESQRRRSTTPLLAQQGRRGTLTATPATSTSAAAPLLPGTPTPATGQDQQTLRTLTAPFLADATALSPLIRPLVAAPQPVLTSWTAVPGVTAPDLLGVPDPGTTSAPSSAPSSRAAR